MNTVLTYKLNSFCGVLSRLIAIGFTYFLFANSAAAGNLNFAWDASTSTNVAGYKIYYGPTSKNYTSSIDAGNKTAQQVTGLTDGAKYFFAVTAYNSGKTVESATSNEVTATVPVPAASTLTVGFTPSKTSGTAPLIVTFTPSANGTVTSWKWNFGTTTIPVSTSQIPTVTFASAGTYTVSLTATGPDGSATTTKQIAVAAQASGGTPPAVVTPPTTGTANNNLVAAFGFEENGGTTAVDASGKANHGVIKEATRIATGRYGKALKFDGVNDWVAVNDSASLDLSSGLTLEAWLYPLSIKSGTALLKEQPGGAVYNLYASEDADLPISSINDGSYRVISGTKQLPINQWSHLVSTYDGQNQRLYVNGVLVSSRAQTGLIKTSTGLLRIGGNSIWGEYFQGYIDEVKIYNRALTSAEIQKDLTTSINVSNPSQMVVGNKTLEAIVDYNPQGMAEAFKTTPTKNAVVTAVQVYLDAGSTATELVAGIYSDNNGHPGSLLAQGKLTVLKAGATNTVPIPTASVVAGKPYWIAILGSKGQIKFRDRMGSGNAPLETSASTTLTTLPNLWVTGSIYPSDGPMSVYGSGY